VPAQVVEAAAEQALLSSLQVELLSVAVVVVAGFHPLLPLENIHIRSKKLQTGKQPI
jgi:hypothetical protein